MILLKANSELKVIFRKLINTMGIQLDWEDIFVIKDNNLLLAGRDGVLLFDFENRVISANSTKVNLKEDSIEQITNNELLQNVLNMTLYVFGKWGKIKGLTVEKDYQQLNQLLGYFLGKLNVDPVLTADNLIFYKDRTSLSYEEIIHTILELQENDEEKDKRNGEENTETEDSEQEEDKLSKRKYDIGLWHKIVWISGRHTFEKEDISESDKVKSRIGNNFYMIAYKCPICGEKLYLVIYPVGKELLIETDEKGVYLARAYTCYHCHRLFTPKPHMLLMEGNVYELDFEDDAEAYEDYLEVIGKQGDRTSNCNFNEYEMDYNKQNRINESSLENICDHIDSMSEHEIYELQDKMDSGFYPSKSTEKYYKIVDAELKNRRNQLERKAGSQDKQKKNKHKKKYINAPSALMKRHTKETSDHSKLRNRIQRASSKRSEYRIKSEGAVKSFDDRKVDSSRKANGKEISKFSANPSYSINHKSSIVPEDKKHSNELTKLENGIFADNQLNPQQKKENGEPGAELRVGYTTVHSEKLPNNTNQEGHDKVKDNGMHHAFNNNKEQILLQKVQDCKQKNYVNIMRTMEEMKKEDCNDKLKENILQTLKDLLDKQGKKELDALRLKIPNRISKEQYIQLKETIEQYGEIDHSTYIKHLDYIRDESEEQEIAAYIKQANAKDRSSLQKLQGKLKNENFEGRNVAPFLENIQDKIHSIDEAAIRRICPDPDSLSFDEGLKAYNEIASIEILPDIKSNILGAIDKRLTKIKRNECEKLVNKLSKEMGKALQEHSRIHFYQVKKEMQNHMEEEETQIIHRALDKYASERGRYEFPILICDASSKENGGRGFVLTPDHIFYNSILNSGVIDIMKINNIITRKKMNHSLVYADTENAGLIKLSNSLKLDNLNLFISVLNDFISYLKEKPESRDISYMVKEKHSVKCCYRCGYVYKGDNVCPKCGAKFNE